MHRQTDYRGQIAFETDFLYAQRFSYEALGLFAADILGTSVLVSGLACAPTGPASLSVNVAPGRIYSFLNLEATAWGVANTVGGLGADTNADHNILKQGLLRDTTNLAAAAPGTVGQSINYLVQASFSETDDGSVVLPFFNASNPSVPWAGPGNSGGSLPVVRADHLSLTIKAGTAATTGTQTTPAPDSGCVGLWVVTVANGQTTITSGNISAYTPSSFIGETLTQKISQATADARYLRLINARTRLTGNTTFYVATTGNDSTGAGTSGSPWATIAHAYTVLQQQYDLAGFTATISIAAGTYTGAQVLNGPVQGNVGYGSVVINGAGAGTTVLNGGGGIALQANSQAALTVQNVSFSNSTFHIQANYDAIVAFGNVTFNGSSSGHVNAVHSTVLLTGPITIAGNTADVFNIGQSSLFILGAYLITATGSPTISQAYFYSSETSTIHVNGTTYTGTITTVAYLVTLNAVLSTGGTLASIPGSSGSTATGGQAA